MEQFLTGDIWKKVNDITKKQKNKIAVISYVTEANLTLTKGDILICDASTYAVKFGMTSAKVISFYYTKGVKIFSQDSLHSKFLLTDSLLVIGSANLSRNTTKLTESSILTNSAVLMSQTSAFCFNLIDESILLSKSKIDNLLKIKVAKRPFKKITKSKTRRMNFGNCYWIINVTEMSDKMDKIEVEYTKNIVKEISKNQKIYADNVNHIRFTGTRPFRTLGKEGDQILMIWEDKNKKTHVYPFNTILRVQKIKECTRFFYDTSKTEGKEISWAKFLSKVKGVDLNRIGKFSNRELSKGEAETLRRLWA